MTDRKDDIDDPLSPIGGAPSPQRQGDYLRVVNGSASTRQESQTDDKPREASSLSGFLKKLIPGKNEPSLQDALKEIADENENAPQSLDQDERTLISNILKLRDTRAIDVMIPRTNIVAIDIETSPDDLLALLAEKQFSRFPVYREDLDDIIGTIHIKDILSAIARKESIRIEGLTRDVPIISPSMPVLDLLLEMKQTRRQMALVVDEFGGIDGLVTANDVINAIIGEIEDEYEVDDQPQIVRTSDGSLLADGRYDIDEFEKEYGVFLSDAERDEIDTLGGLVFSIAGRVPGRGEIIPHDSGLIFEVLDDDPRRVRRLRIKNVSQ